MKRYYHSSPRRFRHGDVLTGNRDGGCGSHHPNVCMTSSPVPHGTIMNQAVDENWHVYEVAPMFEVSHNPVWGEFQTRAARVIRNIGRAPAFAKHGSLDSVWSSFDGLAYSWVGDEKRRNRKLWENFLKTLERKTK